MKIFAIFIFGVLGVFSRYSFEQFALKSSISTFIVNMLGCLFAGFIYASDKFSQEWKIILLVGLCGGLTTFSGHILQTLKLIEHGNYLQSSIYLFLPPLVGMFILMVGIKIARMFL